MKQIEQREFELIINEEEKTKELKPIYIEEYPRIPGIILSGVLLAAEPSKKYFQNPATEYFNSMIDLHNDIMFFLVFITLFLF